MERGGTHSKRSGQAYSSCRQELCQRGSARGAWMVDTVGEERTFDASVLGENSQKGEER